MWYYFGSNIEERGKSGLAHFMEHLMFKGTKKHPIYQFLTQKSKNNYRDSRVTWNFQKYLINKEGRIEKIISPRTRPDSQEIVSWITDGQ